MALMRLTMTFFFAIAMAPLERHTVTIIGSISGVSPTATASAKKNASCQLALRQAVDDEDQRHHDEDEPQHEPREARDALVERRLRRLRGERPGHAAEVRVAPRGDDDGRGGAALDARAEKREVRAARSAIVSAGRVSTSNFSTGKDSPVSELCMTNRSFAPTIRTSAGIMSPAASLTMSPGTRWATGSSCGWPSRNTAAVTEIMAFSFAAVVSARRSCVSRRPTPSTIISDITMPARASPVEKEIVASTASSSTSGLMTACQTSSAEALAVHRRRRCWARARPVAPRPRPW